MTAEKAKEILFQQWQEFLEHNLDYAGVSDAYKMAVEALERSTGHWIAEEMKTYIDGNRKDWIAYKCSSCGNFSKDNHDYCPNCGAKMEGKE